MPLISVIMPAYNAEKYIKEAIDSILNQTERDFELIIINDCSQDATENIILSYQDSRIVYLKNEQNLGVAETLNRGLAAASGQFIARMDADDVAMPERFEKQAVYLQAHPSTVVCGSKIEIFGEGIQRTICHYPEENGKIKAFLYFACPFAHPSVMVRREVLIQHSLCYEREFEKVEDYRLWTRLAKFGEFVNLPDPLLCYRKHPGQVCATSPQVQYEGKLRIAKMLLTDLGITDSEEQKRIMDAFDNRLSNRRDFDAFLAIASRVCRCDISTIDCDYLRTLLKSRVIEIATLNYFHLPVRTIGLVGIKAWIYVNTRRKS